jgi:hypothetical protein
MFDFQQRICIFVRHACNRVAPQPDQATRKLDIPQSLGSVPNSHNHYSFVHGDHDHLIAGFLAHILVQIETPDPVTVLHFQVILKRGTKLGQRIKRHEAVAQNTSFACSRQQDNLLDSIFLIWATGYWQSRRKNKVGLAGVVIRFWR